MALFSSVFKGDLNPSPNGVRNRLGSELPAP